MGLNCQISLPSPQKPTIRAAQTSVGLLVVFCEGAFVWLVKLASALWSGNQKYSSSRNIEEVKMVKYSSFCAKRL